MKRAFNFPSFIALAVVTGALTQLAACGQTGPLYLPAKPKALSTPAQAPEATQEKSAPAMQEPAPVTK